MFPRRRVKRAWIHRNKNRPMGLRSGGGRCRPAWTEFCCQSATGLSETYLTHGERPSCRRQYPLSACAQPSNAVEEQAHQAGLPTHADAREDCAQACWCDLAAHVQHLGRIFRKHSLTTSSEAPSHSLGSARPMMGQQSFAVAMARGRQTTQHVGKPGMRAVGFGHKTQDRPSYAGSAAGLIPSSQPTISSAAFSPTITQAAWVLQEMVVGNTEASAMRRLSMPTTCKCGFTTASGSVPIRQLPTG